MGYRYVILGAGRQGTACAYDLALFGEAERIVLADANPDFSQKSAERLRRLLPSSNTTRIEAVEISVQNHSDLMKVLRDASAVMSAVPYYYNPRIARAAIDAAVPMCDLGGDIEAVLEVQRLSGAAKAAGIAIVPDCGLAPGMNNILAVYGMERLDETVSVQIRCGGLPQIPRPPLAYRVVFNLDGMLNNYFGKAYVLRNAKVTEIETFSGLEKIRFPKPLGACEAFVTAGATSSCPWTFEGRLQSYDYKTVRYAGHYEKIKLLRDLGLLDLRPVSVKGTSVAPRDLFVKVVGDRIAFPEDRDLVVLRVICRGRKNRRPAEVVLDMLEYHDPATGFSAMERTTGFSTGIVAAMLARGEIREKGVVPLETAIPAGPFVKELGRRGMAVREKIVYRKNRRKIKG
ncbi:MAG TPA: saccharopine dehydrogenase C-terminal domain-containing protein [Nitrospiria bacterium]|jgi:lysine 6-dehydrogenase|nr:saccharopine dehydrogenase C-terminal domain-containing protein [Nitrospiria bacterium]